MRITGIASYEKRTNFIPNVESRVTDGMDAEGTKQMLYQWTYRNYLTVLTDYSFKKIKYRKEVKSEI